MRARYRESESLVNDLRREFGEDLGRTLGGPWEFGQDFWEGSADYCRADPIYNHLFSFPSLTLYFFYSLISDYYAPVFSFCSVR